jgi:hypothetical protein
VASFYFDIHDSAVKKWGSKYIAAHNIDSVLRAGGSTDLTALAQRIWCEQDGNVWFVKHRTSNIRRLEVDMKEFMWIKLNSKSI